jgi:hypothetical protein
MAAIHSLCGLISTIKGKAVAELGNFSAFNFNFYYSPPYKLIRNLLDCIFPLGVMFDVKSLSVFRENPLRKHEQIFLRRVHRTSSFGRPGSAYSS